MAVVSWQSAEQRCREVEAADAASVARLVRGVRSLHVARSASSLRLYLSCAWCGGDDVVVMVWW